MSTEEWVRSCFVLGDFDVVKVIPIPPNEKINWVDNPPHVMHIEFVVSNPLYQSR